MMFKVVGGIVGGAKMRDVKVFQNALGRKFRCRELSIGFLPDTRGALFVQQFVNAEITFQFKVGPVVQGIAQRVGNCSRPGLKFCESDRRRPCKIFRPHHWRASLATCSGRLPAKSRRGC